MLSGNMLMGLLFLLVILVVILNPVNWIKLAVWLLGSERAEKFLSNLQAQINAEPDLQKRWLDQSVLDRAIGRKHDGD